MNGMPRNWAVRPISELVGVQNGYAFASELFSKSDGMPLIRIRDLRNGVTTETRYSGEYDPSYVVRSGDYLIGMDGEFRCYKWIGNDALLNQRVCRLVNFNKLLIDPAFLFYGINAHLRRIEDETPYVTVKHLSSRAINSISFAFPPLPEQRRIVARIQECLKRVDEIERLRTKSIAEAKALAPVLYDAIQNEPNWPLVELRDVILGSGNGKSLRQDNASATGYVLSLSAVHDVVLDCSARKPIELTKALAERYQVKEGYVYVSRSNTRELVGLASVAESTPIQTIYPDLLIQLLVDSSAIRPRFLAYALRTRDSRRQIQDRAVGTSQSMVKISADRLKEVILRLPPLSVQDELITNLDECRELAQRIGCYIRDCDSQHLRDAVLRKAFAGEL